MDYTLILLYPNDIFLKWVSRFESIDVSFCSLEKDLITNFIKPPSYPSCRCSQQHHRNHCMLTPRQHHLMLSRRQHHRHRRQHHRLQVGLLTHIKRQRKVSKMICTMISMICGRRNRRS